MRSGRQTELFLSQRGLQQHQRNNSNEIWDLFAGSPYITLKMKASQPKQPEKATQIQSEQQQPIKITEQIPISTAIHTSIPPQKVFVKTERKYKSIDIKKRSIERYLKKLKPYTRQLPNSAIKRFYEKPCQQIYGSKNINFNTVLYGNYMKTHNVLPHTMSNKPKKYQTYESAINFSKRTKLDQQDRWRRIHIQLSKDLDLKTLAQDQADGYIVVSEKQEKLKKSKSLKQALKVNIKQLAAKKFQVQMTNVTNSLKRSKSANNINNTINLGSNSVMENATMVKAISTNNANYDKEPYNVFKFTDKNNQQRYAKDRHGITCYVDPTFYDNQQAYTNFLKNTNKLQPDDVRPEDKNIDKLRIANFIRSQEEDITKHYLMPCVQIPYDANNYSLRRKSSRKKQMQQTRES